MPGVFNKFVNQKTVLLTTYRRDGTPVGTPVNIVVDGERAFVRTFDTAWKLKRIKKNSRVEIAPSTVRGKPTGSAISARARVLGGSESEHASRALNKSTQSCTVSLCRSLIASRVIKPFTSNLRPSHRRRRSQTLSISGLTFLRCGSDFLCSCS